MVPYAIFLTIFNPSSRYVARCCKNIINVSACCLRTTQPRGARLVGQDKEFKSGKNLQISSSPRNISPKSQLINFFLILDLPVEQGLVRRANSIEMLLASNQHVVVKWVVSGPPTFHLSRDRQPNGQFIVGHKAN